MPYFIFDQIDRLLFKNQWGSRPPPLSKMCQRSTVKQDHPYCFGLFTVHVEIEVFVLDALVGSI